jgi:succinoglycan biosynthesis protein ExoM
MTFLVSICVATYKRPDGLKRLLDGINQLTFKKIKPPNIEVIVVDNDFLGSARDFCESMKADFQWTLKYDVEPIQGVTYARNKTIANISEHSDFIAIIDDDEVPEPNWIEELLLVQEEYKVDIVAGRVNAHFEENDVPEWVKKGNFFEPKHFPTGHQRQTAFTNNVLIRTQILDQLEPIFDERYAIKGSEDTHLFMRLHKAGNKIVWANEAVVTEWIPKSRTNLKWILERAYWGWSSYSLFERDLYPSTKLQLIRFFKGVALMIVGIILMIPAILRGKFALAQALLNLYRGAGTFAGLLGLQGDWQTPGNKKVISH